MSDYMPTADDIREGYCESELDKPSYPATLAEFDRWLKQVKAEAWSEGFDAGERDVWEHEHSEDGWDADCIANPYLEGEK